MKAGELIEALKFNRILPSPSPNGIDLWDEDAPRRFAFKGQECSFAPWRGERIAGESVALDTETFHIGEQLDRGGVPKLVLASASGSAPNANYVIHPDDLGPFLLTHRHRQLVFFNIAFDVPVIEKALRVRGQMEAAEALRRMVTGKQCHDAMLLDQLVRLAEGRRPYYPRALAVVAYELLGVELPKDEALRLGFSSVWKRDYRGIEPEFYEYAVRDSRATLLVFEKLFQKAWRLHAAYTREGGSEGDPERATPWGPLTEQLQVRAALAFRNMAEQGVRVDMSRLKEIIKERKRQMRQAIRAFNSDPAVRAFEKETGSHILQRKKGRIESTERGGPRRHVKAVRAFFAHLCRRHGQDPPLTHRGFVSTARDDYVGTEALEQEAAMEKYFRLQDIAAELNKAEEILKNVSGDGRVHPHYKTLLKTGRASCASPQVQNLPRTGDLRSCFIPTDGHIFYTVDYSTLELAALASICRHRYGYSRLAEKIAAGEDLHVFTAASILGKPAEQVTPEERQAANVYNFGVPGGMGPRALAHQARVAYGIEMSVPEAARWRQALIENIYPELGEFLNDSLGRYICGVLGVPEDEIIEDLIVSTEADRFSPDARSWILSSAERALRTGTKPDGSRYSPEWTDRIWSGLATAYGRSGRKDPEIERHLRDGISCPAAARAFFPTRAVALTGRVWSEVNPRQAHNAQFQGLAADGAKLALYRLVREGYKPVLFIHDEVVFEVRDDEHKESIASEIERIMVEEMSRVINDVPIRVKGKFMQWWEK